MILFEDPFCTSHKHKRFVEMISRSIVQSQHVEIPKQSRVVEGSVVISNRVFGNKVIKKKFIFFVPTN